jgi:thiol-disulfide isomerase/thioredoxin
MLLSTLLLLLATTAPAANHLADVQTLSDVLHTFKPASRIRVVNVWATWCAPCVAEIGDVQTLADSLRDSRGEVIGVSLDDAIPGERAASKEKLQRFLDSRHIRFRNLYYVGRPSELADELRFDGTIPITIVYDPNGHELARNEGKLDLPWLQRTLAELVKTSDKGGRK